MLFAALREIAKTRFAATLQFEYTQDVLLRLT